MGRVTRGCHAAPETAAGDPGRGNRFLKAALEGLFQLHNIIARVSIISLHDTALNIKVDCSVFLAPSLPKTDVNPYE